MEGNKSARDTPVYEELEEIHSFVATVPSSLDILVWRSKGALRQEANYLVHEAWSEAFVPSEVEEAPR